MPIIADTGCSSEKEEREQRLKKLVRRGLPPFPQIALELEKLLGGQSPDVKRAGKLIAADPVFSSQVLRICNSPMFGLRNRVINIDQATMLLGTDRLRNLALTSSLVDVTNKLLAHPEMTEFWQHSLTAGMLSECLAQLYEYSEKEQAYIAGLLHDIGRIPLYMVTDEAKGKDEKALVPGWEDDIGLQADYFGTDHCELGAGMAQFWDFLPSFVDVLTNHHKPENSNHDPILVNIVATCELLLQVKEEEVRELLGPEGHLRLATTRDRLEKQGKELFGEMQWPDVEEDLRAQYDRISKLVASGLEGILTNRDRCS